MKKHIRNQLYKMMFSSSLSLQKKVPNTVKNYTSANLKAQFDKNYTTVKFHLGGDSYGESGEFIF